MKQLAKTLKNIGFSVLATWLLVPVSYAGNLVLIADSANIESLSKVVARLKTEALAAQQKKTNKGEPLSPEYAEALELSLSDLRVALPQVVENIAKSKGADVVIEPAVVAKFALSGENISAEVARELDLRSANLKFLAP